MQANTEIAKNTINPYEMVGEYVVPAGMIDLKAPADMLKSMMQKVMENPDDKNLQAAMEVMVTGAKGIVDAGKEQNIQARNMIDVLKINRQLDFI
jgi:hypothetical protein